MQGFNLFLIGCIIGLMVGITLHARISTKLVVMPSAENTTQSSSVGLFLMLIGAMTFVGTLIVVFN